MNDTFDPTSGCAYIYVESGPVAATQEIDADRLVDLTATGEVVGIEFLNAGRGVRVQGLPVNADFLGYHVRQLGIPVLDYAPTVNRTSVPNLPTLGIFSGGQSLSPIMVHVVNKDTWRDHNLQVGGSLVILQGPVSSPAFSTGPTEQGVPARQYA